MIKVGRLPKVVEAQTMLRALPVIPGNAKLRARLTEGIGVLVRLDRTRATAVANPDPATRARATQSIRELTDDASRLFGIEIGGITIGRVTGALDPATGTIRGSVPVTLTGVFLPGASVDSLEGDLDVSAHTGALRAPTGDVDPGLLRLAQLTPSLGLRNVRATGVQLAQGSVGDVTIERLSGTVLAGENGIRIPDLRVDGLVVQDVAIGSEHDGVRAKEVRLTGMSVDAELLFTGAGDRRRLTGAVVHSLEILSLDGAEIVHEGPRPEGSIRVRIKRGELHDIRADGVELSHGDDAWDVLAGSASVGSVVDLRYAVALATVAVKGRKAERTSIAGTLSTGKAGGRAPTLAVGYSTVGGRRYTLDVHDLIASGTTYTSPGGTLRIETATLQKAHVAGGASGIKATATVADIRVGAIRWPVGTGTLAGSGPVTVATATLAASYDATRTPAWSITEIDLTDVTASDLVYSDPPARFELGAHSGPASADAPLRAGRVRLRPAAGTYRVEDFHTDVKGRLTSSLGVEGKLGLDSADVTLTRSGHIVAVVRGGSGGVTLSGDVNARVDLTGLRGASIDIGPDEIKIGGADAGSPDGLTIDRVALMSFDLRTVLAGSTVRLRTGTSGSVTMNGVHAKARLEKWGPHDVRTGSSPFRRVVVERLDIDETVVSALQVDLPGQDLTAVMPPATASDPVTIAGLSLTRGRNSAGEFQQDFVYDMGSGAMTGSLSARALTVPLHAELGKKLSGDVLLTTGYATIDWLRTGGVRVVVNDPAVAMRTMATIPGGRVRVGKLAADELLI